MKNLVGAGISLRQLLAAATIDNAKAFDIDDRYGTIEPGKIADLVLRENPLGSVEALDSIEAVVLYGNRSSERRFRRHGKRASDSRRTTALSTTKGAVTILHGKLRRDGVTS